MQVVGIVSEIKHPAGVYIREGAADPKAVAEAYIKSLIKSDGGSNSVAVAAAIVGAATVSSYVVPMSALAAIARYMLSPDRKIVRVKELDNKQPVVGSVARGGIVIPSKSLDGQYGDFDSPILHGLFSGRNEFKTVMEAEGGNVDLTLLDQHVANDVYRHYLGAPFSTGLHLPHPKDPAVLIPVRDYASGLLREVHGEWVQTFEALGAKAIVIGDSTSFKASAKGSKNVAGVGTVGAEMRGSYGNENIEESTYASGTFDPARAMANRRWIRDYPEITSIVDGRIHGNQTSWRRAIRVNAEFGVSSKVLGVFSAQLAGGYQRSYDFYVEFHPKG